MRCWRAILLACAAMLLAAGCGKKESAARDAASAPARRDPSGPSPAGTRAKGFRFAAEYYPTDSNGVQRVKTMVLGNEATFPKKDVVFVTSPRIEGYKEDGTLQFVVTSVDAQVSLTSRSAEGTNVVSFASGDTNFYAAGRGFHWNPSNSVLILSNQTYNWINQRMLTNSSPIE